MPVGGVGGQQYAKLVDLHGNEHHGRDDEHHYHCLADLRGGVDVAVTHCGHGDNKEVKRVQEGHHTAGNTRGLARSIAGAVDGLARVGGCDAVAVAAHLRQGHVGRARGRPAGVGSDEVAVVVPGKGGGLVRVCVRS